MKHDITDWRVGPWIVQPSLNQISRSGESFRTTPKVIAALLCLAEHQGEVVSRDTLLQSVWGDTIVSDDSLNRAISDIRSIFGDNPNNPHVIETIRQRGYRLLLPAHPITPRTIHKKVRSTYGWKVYSSLIGVVVILCVLALSRSSVTEPAPGTEHRLVPLTTEPGFEFDVSLSRDGNQIAYAHYRDDNRQVDLYVKQIGIESHQQLTDNGRIEMSPAWSPDGRSVAFLALDVPNEECGLYAITLLGGDERKLADCETFLVTGVSWSPDGQKIAFSDRKDRSEPFRIYLLDLQTRSITQLTDPPSDLFGDFSATFSPDGTSIGFIRGTVAATSTLLTIPAVGDVYTISLEDNTEKRLTFENQEILHIDWMQDGKHIAFASNREQGAPGLWKVHTNGGSPVWLFGNNTHLRKPMFARTNKRLVFEQWNNETSIWQIELDSLKISGQGAAKPLIHSTHFDSAPQYSPDGQFLAFTSSRSGSTEIWISDADGNRPMQLTSLAGPQISSPRWSPDGSALTFETRTDGQTDIYTIATGGGVPKRITSHTMEDMVPVWSNDGHWLYFASNRTGDWQIWRKQAQGKGRSQQITKDGGFMPFISPDTTINDLFYTRMDKEGLFKVPMDGGQEEVVLPGLRADDWGNVTFTKDGIFVLMRVPSRIMLYDYATMQGTDLGTIWRIPAGKVGFSVTPDHKTLAFVQQRHQNADIWMIDNSEAF